MHDQSWKAPPFSRSASGLYFYLLHHGGCVRMRQLLCHGPFAAAQLPAAVNELAERCRITITLRPPRDRESAGLADIDRITVTSWARRQPFRM